jgi:hypothetical protein
MEDVGESYFDELINRSIYDSTISNEHKRTC